MRRVKLGVMRPVADDGSVAHSKECVKSLFRDDAVLPVVNEINDFN
jgi:hypothetical protein